MTQPKTKTTEEKLMAFLDWCRKRPAFNSPNATAMEITASAERIWQEISYHKNFEEQESGIHEPESKTTTQELIDWAEDVGIKSEYLTTYHPESVEKLEQIRARLLVAQEMAEALKPFSDCIYNDNGDITTNFRHISAEELKCAYFARKKWESLNDQQKEQV